MKFQKFTMLAVERTPMGHLRRPKYVILFMFIKTERLTVKRAESAITALPNKTDSFYHPLFIIDLFM